MLTGESDLVLKGEGDELLSGSFLVSGQVYARVNRVGANNYANKIDGRGEKLSKPINRAFSIISQKSLVSLVRLLSHLVSPSSVKPF